ncbi:hypothetical protein GCM10022200_23120 [Microbacterium awajiense]|uniref:ABC transporter domain-containing protein n=1 Tax=Microbacterium awajiense TaxID=415214 RepID=A0ABP7ARL6_9MICO
MPDGQVIDFAGITKRFGGITAVDGFTARAAPGVVTGFLGPNGAGKTTTLRMLLGLVAPTSGRATIGGQRYAQLKHPLRTVGATLEASSFHPGRTGAAHLTIYAQAAGLARTRVDEVLGLVGLADAAGRKVGGYSLGMRQRLGLAYALLGDPGVLVLDEPANGLDPEGIRWMRGFLGQLAREGRTVLVSSHLLAEVQQTVDALLIISRGRLVFQGALNELADPGEYATVVDSPDRAALAAALAEAGIGHDVLRSGFIAHGAGTADVGAAAAAAGVALSLLQRRGPALEEVFLELVDGIRVHETASPVSTPEATSAVMHVAPDAEVETERADDLPPASTPDPDPDPDSDSDSDSDSGPGSGPDSDSGVEEPTSDAGEPEEPPVGDRPWEDYVKTDADHEADAFFASYDDEADSAQQPATAPADEERREADEEAEPGSTEAGDDR